MEEDDGLAATVASPSEAGFAATSPRVRGPAREVPAAIGRYRVVRQLGQGGMGIVYLAIDPKLDRKVAIKLLHRADTDGRLLREGQAIAKLHHPNVVGVHDVGEHGAELFIAMEYVPGGTLGDWLAEPRPWREVIARFVAAGRGLAAAHDAGLVHRDFKPDNVLLGDGDRVVVTDFGIARAGASAAAPAGDVSVTRTGGLLGTPAYMSPEQLRGEVIDARSDPFSFCVAAWEALFGGRPYDPTGVVARSLDELRQNVLERRIAPPTRKVPASIVRALRRGLERAPEARYASMEELLAALRPPRRRAPWIAAGIAIVAAGAVFAVTRPGGSPTGADCAATAAAIDADWDATARDAFLATPGDAALAAEDAAWFDEVATSWQATRMAVCRDPELAADRRAVAETCLDEARSALVAAIARGDRDAYPVLRDPTACRSGVMPAPAATRFLQGGQGNVACAAAFSPDGKQLALTTNLGAAALLDVETGRAMPSSMPRLTWIRDWTGDGRSILGEIDHQAVRVELEAGEVTALGAVLARSPDLTTTVRLDGSTMVFASVDPAREIARVEVPDEDTWHLAWEPAGHRVAFAIQTPSERAAVILVDVVSGAVTRLPLRLVGSYTYPRAAWLGPGALVVAGAPTVKARSALWQLLVDERGALRSFPRWWLTYDENLYGEVVAARPGQVVMTTFDASMKLVEARGARNLPIPGSQALLVGADATRGRVLLGDQHDLYLLDREGRLLATHARAPDLVFGLHDGVLLVGTRANDRDDVPMIAAGAPAGTTPALALPADVAGRVYCNPWRPDRCLAVRAGGSSTRLAVLAGDRAGPARTLQGEVTRAWPSADGTRAVVTSHTADVPGAFVLDLATGARRELPEDPDAVWCSHYQWGPDDRAIYHVVAVKGDDGRFQVRRRDRAGVDAEVVLDTGMVWISALAVFAEDDLLYTAAEFPSKLALIERAD